jgi:hypothetical protein
MRLPWLTGRDQGRNRFHKWVGMLPSPALCSRVEDDEHMARDRGLSDRREGGFAVEWPFGVIAVDGRFLGFVALARKIGLAKFDTEPDSGLYLPVHKRESN